MSCCDNFVIYAVRKIPRPGSLACFRLLPLPGRSGVAQTMGYFESIFYVHKALYVPNIGLKRAGRVKPTPSNPNHPTSARVPLLINSG